MRWLDATGLSTRLKRRVIAIASFIIFSIVALLVLSALRAKQDALESAQLQASYLAAALREDAEKALNNLAVAAEIAKRRIEDKEGQPFLAELKESVSKYTAALVNVSVIAADGTLRATSGDVEALPKDFSKFPLFLESKASPSLGIRLGLPRAGILQIGPVIPVGVRLETRDGHFYGMLLFLLEPERSATMYRRVDLGQSGSLLLIDENGILYTGCTLPRGFDRSAIGVPVFSAQTVAALQSGSSGTIEAKSLIDGIDRIYAWRRLSTARGFAVAGIGRREALAGARRQAIRLLALGILTTGLFAWLTSMLVQEIARRTRQALMLDQQRTILRAKNDELTKAKLRAEELSQSKTLFLANIVHELRTSLNSILGFAEIIRSRTFGNAPERYSGYAADIYEAGNHILNVIRNLLDFTKIESGKFELHEEWVDIKELGSECLHQLRGQAENRGVELVSQFEGHDLSLYADATVLKQIAFNLLSNAIKFTPKGGTARLGFQPNESGALIFSVKDSGIGMTESEIELALKPFSQIRSDFSAPAEGTGLGLPLVAQLVGLHGGVLSIKSKPGAGTAVTIIFPASRVKIIATPNGGSAEQENPGGTAKLEH